MLYYFLIFLSQSFLPIYGIFNLDFPPRERYLTRALNKIASHTANWITKGRGAKCNARRVEMKMQDYIDNRNIALGHLKYRGRGG